MRNSFFLPALTRLSRFIRVPFFLFFLSSCGSDPFPGYSKTSEGVLFKLHSFSEGEGKLKEGQVILIDLASFDEKGSSRGRIFNRYFYFKRQVDTSHGLPMLAEVISDGIVSSLEEMDLSQGDSVSILSGTIENRYDTRLELKLVRLLSLPEYEAEQERLAEVGDIEENKALKKYISDHNITAGPVENGLYILPVAAGKGDSVKAGKMVTIAFKGYFLDGRQFDATKEPMEFPFSAEMQVIEGIRMALGRMKEGDKSKIIIPSHFAYGEKGSSTGVVPPFTTVIYEVEVVKVK